MILRISVLTGVAVGVFSALYFLSLVIGAGAIVPLIISAAIIAALVWWFRMPARAVATAPPPVWLQIVFWIVLAASIAAFIVLGFKEPHGDWSAWSVWNLHARFLERAGGSQWTALFSPQMAWSHPGYPLLLPAFIAQIWAVLHSESTVVPFVVASLFTFATAALLIGALRQFRGWNAALIAGAFLLGSRDFLAQGAMQYADIPLAFYMLAALALLCLDDVKCTILAGAMAGLAAWTKNEGLLFVVVLIAARYIARRRFGKTAGFARELAQLAIGAAPILLVLALFKVGYAPWNEVLFSLSPSDVLSRAFDIGRWIAVVEGIVRLAFQLGAFLIPGILLIAAYAWLVRFKIEPDDRLGITTVVAAIGLMLIGDFAVYILFTNDLITQVNSSLVRLFVQVVPAGLFAFFWATTPVDLRPAAPPEPKKHLKKTAATRRR